MGLPLDHMLQQGLAAHHAGNFQEAERLYRAIMQSQPEHPDANHNLGLLAVLANQVEAALPLFKTALNVNPSKEQFWVSYIDALVKAKSLKDAKRAIKKAKKEGFDTKKLQALLSKSKGVTETKVPSQAQLNSLLEHYQNGRFSEAEKLATSISQEFPQHQLAWKVLGAIFGQTGKKIEAAHANQAAVALSPQDAEAHSNLGVTLQELGKLNEAEASLTQAIALKPDSAEAHNNLSITLQKLGRWDEAEASCIQAIALKPDFAQAHTTLGITLKELDRLDEAEASYTQAIALKPDYAQAHSNLAKVLYKLGRKDSALESIENANDIDPEKREYKLILSVLKARKSREESVVAISDTDALTGLASSPIILTRVVEPELITNLYGINSRELDKASDARYGNGKCSPDFNLFQDSRSIIQKLAKDLTRIMMEAVKSDVYIYDSFFNILGAGGGTTPHKHISELDNDSVFNLGKQKYSLVYYLSVGDQDCSEPGVLKLYEPSEDILPSEGMIMIIPASRVHSAVYGGKTDRVMIGVNFYSV